MEARPTSLPQARRVFELARRDREAAERLLASLSPEEQVAIVCEAPAELRGRLLDLTAEPERVIPLLPEAELCFTVKAMGVADASALLEHASAAQIVASLDLDAWKGLQPDLRSLDDWMAALALAGDDALLRAAQSLDAELLVLYLRDHVDVVLKPSDSEGSDDWEPPEGAQTLEGQFYFAPRRDGDDLAPLLRMLHALFQKDYWLYFRLLQGAGWELQPDLEEWALRWRTGRLEDLGFPAWDEAMRIYGYIRPDRRAEIPSDSRALDVRQWQLPVWISQLPAGADAQHSIFRAAAGLDDEERRGFFYGFIGLANKVAVADAMPLGDPETLPIALERAASTASSGLELIASENGIGLAEALRRVPLERLFRVGASLEPGQDRPQRT